MARVLVTPRSLTRKPHSAMALLEAKGFEVIYCTPGQTPGEAELIGLMPGVVGWLAGVEPVSEAVVAAADALRVVSRNGVGVDNLPMAALGARGVTVRTADGANANGVAELTLGLLLASLRNIAREDAGIKAGGWPRLQGREIRGSRVGVVGCGAIGREVARLASAFGASIIAFDPMRPALDPAVRLDRWATLEELLAEADIVCLHCPPPRDGRPLIGAVELAGMKKGAVLVNTARSALVDDAAVVAALDGGRLGAYAADVFAQEPPASLALAGHVRVVASSHVGGFTAESVDRATEVAVDNLLAELGKTR